MDVLLWNKLADAALTALYAALFFVSARSVRRTKLWALVIGAGVSCLYNVLYGITAYSATASTVALAARLAVGVEACARVATKRTERLALWILAAGSIEACMWPGATWHYMPARHISTTVAALACLLFYGISPSTVAGRHGRLAGAWLATQAVMSWSVPLYNTSWPRRIAARWLYVIAVAAIVAAWTATFRPAREESAGPAASAGQPQK